MSDDDDPSGPGDDNPALQTLDDDRTDRELSMAQLKQRLEAKRLAAARGEAEDPLATPSSARPRERDDELLSDPPETDYHLGRLGGWRAGRHLRWMIFGVFGSIAIAGAILTFVHARQREHDRLHPLPEVEATIAPGTSREMTVSEGQFRLGIAREAPSVNIVHLPDRDITLAEGEDKAQFKVEVSDGKTTKIVVLTGGIVETLYDGAQPLL